MVCQHLTSGLLVKSMFGWLENPNKPKQGEILSGGIPNNSEHKPKSKHIYKFSWPEGRQTSQRLNKLLLKAVPKENYYNQQGKKVFLKTNYLPGLIK